MTAYASNAVPDVATREGGVDRNFDFLKPKPKVNVVATREGGVDRNIKEKTQRADIDGRHPRGWRG